MATTIHNFPSDGTLVARGTDSVAGGGTVLTGLSRVDGFVATCATADVVISVQSISNGVVTVDVYLAGASSAGARTIYWKAWQAKKI